MQPKKDTDTHTRDGKEINRVHHLRSLGKRFAKKSEKIIHCEFIREMQLDETGNTLPEFRDQLVIVAFGEKKPLCGGGETQSVVGGGVRWR